MALLVGLVLGEFEHLGFFSVFVSPCGFPSPAFFLVLV